MTMAVWLKVSYETIPDIEVPGETVRGRALLVTATQASHQPLGFLCVAWFVVASSLVPVTLQGTACYNNLGLGVALTPPFILKGYRTATRDSSGYVCCV